MQLPRCRNVPRSGSGFVYTNYGPESFATLIRGEGGGRLCAELVTRTGFTAGAIRANGRLRRSAATGSATWMVENCVPGGLPQEQVQIVLARPGLVVLVAAQHGDPHSDSFRPASRTAGKLICARLENGTATTGSALPTASTSSPGGSVSEMPAAHFAMELQVRGAAITASAGGRTSGGAGFLVVAAHRVSAPADVSPDGRRNI